VNLNINVGFLGLSQSQLNMSSLVSNSTTLTLKYQTVLAGPIDTGVIFNFKYHFFFADNSTVTSFTNFLRGIAIEQDTTAQPSGTPSFINPYFANSSTLQIARNYFYDAAKVENWLKQNGSFVTPSTTGYTVFIADLHGSLSDQSFSYAEYNEYNAHCTICTRTIVTAHYYNVTAQDPQTVLNTSIYPQAQATGLMNYRYK
jgi:hypothetical protein